MREVPHNMCFTTTIRSLCVVFTCRLFLQFHAIFDHLNNSKIILACALCCANHACPSCPSASAQNGQTLFRLSAFIALLCILTFVSYCCQSNLICAVHTPKQEHPVSRYNASKLLHNKTGNSLCSLCRKVLPGSGCGAASAVFSRKSRPKITWIAQ